MQSPSKLLKTGTMPDTNTILALVLINVMAGLMVSFVTNRWFVRPSSTIVEVYPDEDEIQQARVYRMQGSPLS